MIQGYHVPPQKGSSWTNLYDCIIDHRINRVGHCFSDMPGTLSPTSLENGWLSIGWFSTLKMGCFTTSIHSKTSCLGLPGISYVFFFWAANQKNPGNWLTCQEWGACRKISPLSEVREYGHWSICARPLGRLGLTDFCWNSDFVDPSWPRKPWKRSSVSDFFQSEIYFHTDFPTWKFRFW